MRACKEHGVYLRVLRKQAFDITAHKEARTFGIELSIFDKRNPEWAGMLRNLQFREEMGNFDEVALGRYCARRRKDADVAGLRAVADGLCGRADDAEYAVRRSDARQILLLDRSERLGARRVAGKNHERATHLEQSFHGLERILVDGFKATRAVRGTRIVAQVCKVILRERLAEFL